MLRGAKFWLLAFVFAYGVWLVHDDSVQFPELLAGLVVATLAATGTELVRRQRLARTRITPGFLRFAYRLVFSAVRDSAALTVAAFKQLVRPQPVRGQVVAMPFRHGGEDARDNGARAVAQGLGSFAPGTIVIGVDPDRDLLITHQLACSPSRSNLDPLELG